MAQRGKRKASAAPTTSSRTPRKKINLNGVTPERARPGRPRKNTADTLRPGEGVIDTTRGSLQKQKARSSSRASSGSNFSFATARSKVSDSFRSFTPTLSSWGKAAQSYRLSDLFKTRSISLEEEKKPIKMNGNGVGNKKIDIKGKGKAVDEDEGGHLSADESARMIQLLEFPVTSQSWHLVNGRKHDFDENSDAQSGHSVENLLFGDGPEESKATLSEKGGHGETNQLVNGLEDDVEDIRLADSHSMNGIEDAAATSQPSSAAKEDAEILTTTEKERPSEHEVSLQRGNADEANANTNRQSDEEKSLDIVNTDDSLGAKHDSAEDDTQVTEPLQVANDDINDSSSVEKEAQESTLDAEATKSSPSLRGEGADEEFIVEPRGGWQGVIDLTECASPEDDSEQSLDKAIEPQKSPTFELRRQPSSGLFANGIMARERQVSEGHSATRVIQQLGSRQMSTSSSFAKVISKPSSGFRKREPIFNRARKSLAKQIASNKANEMVSALRRRVKLVMHTPNYLDEMLQKKVALEKAQGDDTPEEELQIRYLRTILARSTASLRPARRHLKEQERLKVEAKLLQKRALGIMGRQPLPRNMTSDREDFVNQTFRKEGKIAQVVGAAVLNRDIIKLRPGVWLNDEVINFYMKLILKRSDEAITKRANARAAKKRVALNEYSSPEDRLTDQALVKEFNKVWNGIWNCWTFTSFFYTKLETEGYSGVRQWTRKVDLFTKDVILLPINISSTHWVCAAINMRKCRFEYYDSMRSRPRGVFEQLKRYLLSEYEDKKKQSAGPLLLDGWGCYVSQQSPLQENAFDCGVFACQTLEQLSRRSPRDFELKDDLNVDKVVQRSRELSETRRRRVDSSDSDSDASDAEAVADEVEDEEEEWNFSQINIPYLRQRMVYEIANTALLNE